MFLRRLKTRVRSMVPQASEISTNTGTQELKDLFYVASTETGQERTDLPLWAMREKSLELAFPSLNVGGRDVQRREIPGVVGGFQLLNLLSADECQDFVKVLDCLGFHADAAVSLPYSVRHMVNCNFCVPDALDGALFERCQHLLPTIAGCPPLGLNAKFRCYKYGAGDYFRPHTDGAWPGTRVRGDQIVADAYGDRLSQLTFLMLLTEGYEGGETRFLQSQGDRQGVAVRTPLGGVLCFPHGYHPDSPLHEGMLVQCGFKYMIRTEVLYSLAARKSLREEASTL